jgi:hypothetical protein
MTAPVSRGHSQWSAKWLHSFGKTIANDHYNCHSIRVANRHELPLRPITEPKLDNSIPHVSALDYSVRREKVLIFSGRLSRPATCCFSRWQLKRRWR